MNNTTCSVPGALIAALALTLATCLGGCKVYQSQGPTATESNPLTPVCHAGKTVRVDDLGVREHLGHGDQLGTCP